MSTFFHPPLMAIFKASMRCIKPVRETGAMGTPDEPIFYEAGDSVPWFVECRWPMNTPVVFYVDVECYWEDGHQVIRPQSANDNGKFVIHVANNGPFLMVGAPTFTICIARSRRIGKPSFNLERVGI